MNTPSDRAVLPPLGALGVVLMLTGGFGPNAGLAALAIAVLLLALALLWRRGETPVLLFVVLLQWLQASVKIFQGNWLGLPVDQLAPQGGNMVMAMSLSLVALAMLTLGMRLGKGQTPADVLGPARWVAFNVRQTTWFAWYCLFVVGSFVAMALAAVVPALSQPFLALAALKWAFFFMLTYATFGSSAPGARWLWMSAAAFEFILGLGGFFSDFKTIFMVSLIGILAAGSTIRIRRLLLAGVLAAAAFYVGIIWTAVKSEYRTFVNLGEQAQVVEVDYDERMDKLLSLVKAIDERQFEQSGQDLISRLSYVEFFALTLDYVPQVVEHTEGAIWWDAVLRPFMPRLLFPNKTAIHDSERTVQYTGVMVAGVDEGASISIGYVGESYIDFGAVGMMLPVFLFGVLLGLTYRWLVVTGPMQGLLGMGMATASLLTFSFMESSITKTFGGFVAFLLVIWLFSRFVAPRYLPWLVSKSSPSLGTLSAFQAQG